MSSSHGAAGATAGTAEDGVAPAGTAVALARDAVSAGVAHPAGTDGDTQASAPAFVRRRDRAARRVDRESGRSPRECDDRFAYRRRPAFQLRLRLRSSLDATAIDFISNDRLRVCPGPWASIMASEEHGGKNASGVPTRAQGRCRGPSRGSG